MPGILRQEWLNSNAFRAYPFAEDQHMTATDGFRLPDDIVLDARLCAFGYSAEPRARLWSAEFTGRSATLVFDVSGTSVSVVCRGNGTWVGKNDGASCMVVTGDVSSIGAGSHEFESGTDILESRVVLFKPHTYVNSLSCSRPAGRLGKLYRSTAYGKVIVEDGVNTTLKIRGNDIVLDVREGIGKSPPCIVDRSSFPCGGVAIQYVNGQCADSDGSFTIYGGDGVAVRTGMYGSIPAVIVSATGNVAAMAGKGYA